MDLNAPVFVAGHRGMVGGAIVRALQARGHTNLLLRTHSELDLTDQAATRRFFASTQPRYVFLAAAKVGGILANRDYPADFIAQNLAIECNVIEAARAQGVERMLFLGSSCIYPKHAPQPIREECLLTGPLEPTNRPYALAKIAGIELCWSHNRQHGTRFLAAMPTNLYGLGDNYHPENSHVIPGLIRRFHDARLRNLPEVTIWGTGTPRREFMYSEDLAEACVFLMSLPVSKFDPLLGVGDVEVFSPPIVNVGVGEDLTILELAKLIAAVVDYRGVIATDPTKPDGTPRKLMDSSRLANLGWKAKTPIQAGLVAAYAEFVARHG